MDKPPFGSKTPDLPKYASDFDKSGVVKNVTGEQMKTERTDCPKDSSPVQNSAKMPKK